jgi:XrtJ-associated TM-motif-TM protein
VSPRIFVFGFGLQRFVSDQRASFWTSIFVVRVPLMKKSILLFLALAGLFAVCPPLSAQGGCLGSPENPTVVLALVGSAGAFVASARTRLRARRKLQK